MKDTQKNIEVIHIVELYSAQHLNILKEWMDYYVDNHGDKNKASNFVVFMMIYEGEYLLKLGVTPKMFNYIRFHNLIEHYNKILYKYYLHKYSWYIPTNLDRYIWKKYMIDKENQLEDT